MALESATYISGLVDTNPAGSDAISQGDDHIRLIKTVLKNTLPNADEAMNGIHTSASEPSPNTAGQIWFDTTANLLKMRNEADSGWIILDASEGARVLDITHKDDGTSLRPASDDTYENSGMYVDVTKISSTSNLYIQFTCFINIACNFSAETYVNMYGYLGDNVGTPATIITDTTAFNLIFFDDFGAGTGIAFDVSNTFSRVYKVTAANCPGGTSGAQTFNWVYKINDRSQSTLTNNSSWTVWEVEE